jgi:flagellar hook-length control protein FliK
VAGNIIAGFAPAAAGGAGKGVTGFAPAAQTPAGFSALLGLVSQSGPSAIQYAVAGDTTSEVVTSALLGAPPLDVEFGLEAPTEPPPDGEALLADLMTALAALELAQANGEPVPPALARKLTETLDALAGILGIPAPAEPVVDPLIAAAANPAGAVPIPPSDQLDGLPVAPATADALAAIASEAHLIAAAEVGAAAPPAPPAPIAPATTPPPAASLAPTVDLPAANTAPATALPSAEVEIPAAPTEQVPSQAASQPAEAEPAIDPAPGLGQLLQKITELAQSLRSHSPGLAGRLDALAQKLSSGEIDAQTLAQLGIDTKLGFTDTDLEQALQRLMSASSEVKGMPAPQAFAAAALKLPPIVVLPAEVKAPAAPEPGPVSTPAAAEAKSYAPTEAAPRLAFERPSERPDNAAPQPQTRNATSETARAAFKPDAPTEPAPPLQQTAQAAASSANAVAGAKAIHAAYQAPFQHINIPQVAFEVVRQFQAGNSRFQIRLDPPELGRIDVKLDVDKNGNVNARMTVERAETLDLMQRDQRALERALAQAGLDSSKTNLEFSLRQNPFGREDGGNGRGDGSPFGGTGDELSGAAEETPDQPLTFYRGSASASGVNLFV